MGALGPGNRTISDLRQNPKVPCDEDTRGFSNYFNLLILLFHIILVIQKSLSLSTGLRIFIDTAKGEKKQENLLLHSCDNIKDMMQLWPFDLLGPGFLIRNLIRIYIYTQICIFHMLILRKGKKKTKLDSNDKENNIVESGSEVSAMVRRRRLAEQTGSRYFDACQLYLGSKME